MVLVPAVSKKPERESAAPVRGGMTRLIRSLGNRLLTGIAFAIPLVITYWVLSFG